MTKAMESGSDAVILDLEDSVPIAGKAEARALVAKTIDAAAPHALPPRRSMCASTARRPNSPPPTWRRWCARASTPSYCPRRKASSEVRATAGAIERAEAARGMKPGSVDIILMIESALGVYRCFDLIKASPRVAATCIGSARDGDLQTDLGCAWSIDGTELLYARSKLLLDTRAAGAEIVPLDGVFADLDDEHGLLADSRLSARLGYVGRTVIHPKQIAPVRQAYAMPATDLAYYERVVAEFEGAEKAGIAAITIDGKLVDYAMFQRAKRVLDAGQARRTVSAHGFFLHARPGSAAQPHQAVARRRVPAGIRQEMRRRRPSAARSLPGARQAGLVRPDPAGRIRRHRRLGDRSRHRAGGDRPAFRRARHVVLPHAQLWRLRHHQGRHGGTETRTAAEDFARRNLVLLRA